MKTKLAAILLSAVATVALAQDPIGADFTTPPNIQPAEDEQSQTDVEQPSTANEDTAPDVSSGAAASVDVRTEGGDTTVVAAQPPPESQAMASDGTWVRQMSLNDLLQVLARRLGLQYFYNPKLADIRVTGNLEEKVPSLDDIKSMALQYDVLVDANGRTLVAYARDQLSQLPKTDYVYTLKYLRPNSRFFTPVVTTGPEMGVSGYQTQPALNDEAGDGIGENFKALLAPALSPNGAVSYEPKTNQLIISDNQYSLARAIEMLDKLDKPKKQIIVQVRILRLNSNAANRSGVDWSQTLGETGLQIGATAVGPLDQIFKTTPVFGNAATVAETALDTAGDVLDGGADAAADVASTNAGIILSPLQLNAVLRALFQNDLATQESGPAVITEDNEPAIFRVVDRIPIVEQEISEGGNGGTPIIATDVRYRIDETDPIDPANSREIGVSVAVTPGLLPDGTIRMKLLPRVASVTKYTKVFTGYRNIYNEYPNVNETSVEARARIPDGYTLVLGGYYQDQDRRIDNKVPLLGDIPGLSFAFRSTTREKIRSNIVFLITPTSYDPSNVEGAVATNEMLRQQYIVPKDSKYPDPDWPKEDSDPNLGQRLSNLWPFKKKDRTKESILSAENPQNEGLRPVITKQQQNQMRLEEEIRGTPASPQE